MDCNYLVRLGIMLLFKSWVFFVILCCLFMSSIVLHLSELKADPVQDPFVYQPAENLSNSKASNSTEEGKKTDSWFERISVKQDFRYRHESIDDETDEFRTRHRFRYRLYVGSRINDMFDLGFQLITGNSDPVSANQTLDDGFSTKDIRIDQGYFSFTPHSELKFSLTGGKFKNPLILPGKSELIWDSDLAPEGLAMSFETSSLDFKALFRSAYYLIEERKGASDSRMYAIQAAARYGFSEKNHVMIGISDFYYDNVKTFPFFYNSEASLGNSVDSTGGYLNDFNLIEFFIETNLSIGRNPLVVFGDFVVNSEAEDNNMGYKAGFRLGALKRKYSWQLRYNYRQLEKDAVIGIFTDSDFCGGGTDSEGHELGFVFAPDERVNTAVSYFLNYRNLESNASYHRLQIDLILKF